MTSNTPWKGTGSTFAFIGIFAIGTSHAAPPTVPQVHEASIVVENELSTDESISRANTSVEPDDIPEDSVSSFDATASATAQRKAAEAIKKKADALKKKVAAAYKDPFYLNDFSYLKDSSYRGWELGEDLKLIPVGRHGALDVGGQYRLRHQNEHNMRGLGLTGRDDNFLLDRTRLFLNYQMNNRVRIFSEFLDAGSSYEDFSPRGIEVQHFDTQNFFADATIADIDAGKLTARLGRQELLFGAQRLISPLDWANNRRTFEGGRLTWSNHDQATDILLTRPVPIDPFRSDSANENQALYGIHHSDKRFENGPIDTYWLGYEDSITVLNVQTLGTLIKGEADDLLWDNEFGYQFGQNPDDSDISAFSLTFGLGRRLKGELKPVVWLFYDWASGDDSINKGWNHLFPLSHRYFGFMDLFGRRNIQDVNAIFTFSPSEKFTVLTWYHYMALANGNQGPYNVNLTPFNPGGTVGSKGLGQELDLLGTYKLNLRSDLVLGYSHFFTGDYYRLSQNALGNPLFDGDADFFYTQWHYNF
jgi:hypothetical protein